MRITHSVFGLSLVFGVPAVASADDLPQQPEQEQETPQEEIPVSPPVTEEQSEQEDTKPGSMTSEDQKVTLDQIPDAAKKTIKKEIGDGKFTDADKEMRGNKVVYEVEYTDAKGKRFELIVAEDGKLLDKHAD